MVAPGRTPAPTISGRGRYTYRVLEKLLPAPVVVEEAFDDPAGVVLFPEEEAALARAVDKRRREFTTTRWCARRAFARLDVPAAPVLPGHRGAPQWPDGLVGSITHCLGYRAVALARAEHLRAIGIDAEPNQELPAGVLKIVSRPEERAVLPGLARADPEVHWDRLLFSAKETVFKAWYPASGHELGFDDATLTFDPAARTFVALLHPPFTAGPDGRATELLGRWFVGDGLVLTALALQ